MPPNTSRFSLDVAECDLVYNARMTTSDTCSQCACPDGIRLETSVAGLIHRVKYLCSQCLANHEDTSEEVAVKLLEQYHELLEEGCHPKMAGHIMKARLERMDSEETQ